MRLLIVSDTHRSNSLFLQLVKKYEPLDLILHAGDIEGSEYTIESAADCPVHMVAGNMDGFSDLPRLDVFDFAGHKFMLTHGDRYSVLMGHDKLKEEALNLGADIVIYGHTHRPVIEESDGLIIANPGSLTNPRQRGEKEGKPSYIIMEIDETGKTDLKIFYLP